MGSYPLSRAGATIALTAALVVAGIPASAGAGTLPAEAGRRAPAAVSTTVQAETTRLAGPTRYDTSVAISQEFEPGVGTAVVAAGANFPDALAGAAAAAHLGGPLLLTPHNVLPPAVKDELVRLDPERILVLGGPGAVSDAVLTQLRTVADADRIGGSDRYATASAIVEKVFTADDSIVIATGRGFADALAAGAAAGSAGDPLLLVDGAQPALPDATLTALDRWNVSRVTIAGGVGAVDVGIEQQLRTAGFEVGRLAGADRFATADEIATTYFGANPPSAFLATGLDFPDALSAGARAGALHAPVLLTRTDCVPAPTSGLVAGVGSHLFVVGGEGVVSAAAAGNTPCPFVPAPAPTWATSGLAFDAQAAIPYSDRAPVNVDDPAIELDETGLRIYRTRDTGVRADHPVAYAQYGISALMEFQEGGDPVWLDRAVRHAERLSQIRTERAGAWWFPYTFRWTYYQRTMLTPWWSGMAQGQALSLFVRLYEETGEERWRTAADRTWASFPQQRDGALPWQTMVDDGLLFFEEYAGNQPPLLVFNGHVFALFGLYDYWRLTGDETVHRYLDGAATTALQIMPRIRVPGGISYYCVQDIYCQSPLWQNSAYHPIHSWQLDTVARLTGDQRFGDWANLLRQDWTPPAARFAAPPSLPLGWEDGPPQ
ncbi:MULTISPECIES: cell wall-binding repeat-containing protein [unclassified Microbacterium]|uniref:cell wall-binding repeat-containing protein n=1 Tax=unclassified Microbacterium TaxID=2609290 RepID=UPI00300F9821